MKLILFVSSLLSFIFYKAAKTEVSLQGTWKGCYKGAVSNEDIVIVIGKNNSIDLYSDEINSKPRATGICRVRNSNEVAISCSWKDANKESVILNGRLNPDNNFVEGDWESNDHLTGSFYLSKEISKSVK
jgi:hypothetical protein